MKNKKFFLFALILLITGSYLFAGGVKELVLDDTWKVSQIETKNVIRQNLKNWIEVHFDSKDKTVKISTGPAWPSILQGIDEVYTYKRGKNNRKLYLRKNGETVNVIAIDLSTNLQKMDWTGWTLRGITIVGKNAPIKRITFTRK